MAMWRSRIRPGGLAALLVLLVACLCGPRSAAGACGGRRLVKEGVRLLNERRYDEAIARLSAAYECDARLTKALLLIGAAHLSLGHAEETLTFYERYAADGQLDPQDRARIPGYFEEVARKLESDYRAAGERGATPVGSGADPLSFLLFAGRAQQHLLRLAAAVTCYERYQRGRAAEADRGARSAAGPDPYAQRLAGYVRELRGALEAVPLADPVEHLQLLRRVCLLGGDLAGAAAVDERLRALLPPPAPPRPPPALRVPAVPVLVEPEPLLPPPSPLPSVAARPARARWRVLTSAALGAAGGGLVGFGASALVADGRCVQPATPFLGCYTVIDSTAVGAGLVGSGAALLAGSALLLSLPLRPSRSQAAGPARPTAPTGSTP